MTLLRQTAVVVAVALSSAQTIASAQSQLAGRVLSETGEPIAGATVMLANLRYAVRTDSLGRFALAGTPGSTLNISTAAEGFRTDTAVVVLGRGRPVVRDFRLVAEDAPLPESNASDRTLRVRVTTEYGDPVAYANLQLNGGRRYVSDDSGKFTLAVASSGALTLLVRRIGFEATEVKLAAMPDTTVRVRLAMVARTLEAQTVTVRSPYVRLDLSGFYARMNEVERGARVGYFVTPEDLALRNPQMVTDAVEQFPNIRIRPIKESERCRNKNAPPGSMCGFPHAGRMRIEDRNGCPLTVYLDGIRIQPSIVGAAPRDEEVNSAVRPNGVAGIEVYPRKVGAPPGYPTYEGAGGTQTCGVVLIWSK